MRHRKKTIKLGRTAEHRKALLANQVCSLIEHQRIKTTLAKAKAVRPLAEKNGNTGQKRVAACAADRPGDIAAKECRKEIVRRDRAEIDNRNGGYTRIVS
jgi:Ribosomal protein L17